MRNAGRSFGKWFQANRQALVWVLISFATLLAAWQLASVFSAGRVQVPAPLEVFRAFFNAMVVPIGRNTILEHAGISLWRVLLGFSVASAIGMAIGISMGLSPAARAVINPIFEFVRPIPPIAWIPLSILWFGLGSANKIFIIFLASFTYVTINSYEGARSVDPRLIGAARMLGAGRGRIFTHVIFPSSVPYIFAGLQIALSVSWAAEVAAEIIYSQNGVGWIITMGMNNGNITQIIVGMIAIGVIGYLLSTLMRALEGRLCRWNKQAK
ncbi:ABC transporter permease [Allofournierella sp.]|uniref:ABC transporter permease n=1 Tax=Allofournierella sp. TaxID=1940256 RepID=UPI003AF08291